MEIIDIHDVQARLFGLLERVERGEEILIARAGDPVIRLVRYERSRKPIASPGSIPAPDFRIGEDFDAPLDPLFDCLLDAR